MTTLEKLFNNNPAWLLNNDRVDAFAVGVVGLSSYDFRLFLVLLLLYIHFSCFFLVLSCTAYYTLPRVRGTYHLSHILGDGHRRRHAPACPRSHSRPPPARLPTPGPAPSFCRTFIFKDPSRGRNVQSETRMDFLAQCNSWAHILDLNKPMSMNFRELTAIEVHTLILKRPHTSTHASQSHTPCLIKHRIGIS